MTASTEKNRSVRLRSVHVFSPEENGYIGWSEEASRDRMLELIEDRDLFMIDGAASAATSKNQRQRGLGFLQVDAPLPCPV